MQNSLNAQRRARCPYAQMPVEQLSDEQLLVRRTKNRQMVSIVALLITMVFVMAFVSELYALAITTVAMFPALDEQLKKGKAITGQLHKRNLR